MDTFRETAFYLTLWYALLSLLGAVLFIVLRGFDLATALLIAANLTLLFAFVLMARAGHLTERSITNGQFWRTLPAKLRPRGEAGIRMARTALEETWLRFAQGAAAVAVVLACLAYASNGVSTTSWAKGMRTIGMISADKSKPIWADYRTARMFPMN